MKVLVVIDMQNDFIDGALGTPEAQAIVANVAAKVKEYAHSDDGVLVYTRDTHYKDYMETLEGKNLLVPHCLIGTNGWKIREEVFQDGSYIIDKTTFGRHNLGSAVRAAVIEKYSKPNIESIEIVGLCTDICVISNAMILKAYYEDIPIIVDSSCCAGVTPERHAAALEAMKCCQIDVI